MADIALHWQFYVGRGDWAYQNGDILINQELSTAVLLSLFTDRLSTPSFIPTDGTKDRRGWWGDTYSKDLWGSRLWQLDRAKKTDDTTILLQARDYCKEALKWLQDDGVVSTIQVNTSWVKADTAGAAINIDIELQQPSKLLPERYNYQWAWDHVPTPYLLPNTPMKTIDIITSPALPVLGLFTLGHDMLGTT